MTKLFSLEGIYSLKVIGQTADLQADLLIATQITSTNQTNLPFLIF